MKYASFFQRLVAFSFEGAIQWLVYLTLLSLGVAGIISFPDFVAFFMLLVVALIWVPVLFVLYLVYATSSLGGGLGKLLVGIAVVTDQEKNLSPLRSFFRLTVGYVISHMVVGVGYLWMFKSREKQTWHDMLTDTYVVSRGGNLWRTVVVAIVTLFILCLNGYFLFNAFNTLGKNQLMIREMQNFLKDIEMAPQTPVETPALEEI